MRHEFLDLSCPKCVDLFALVRFLMSLTPPTLNDATRTSLPFKPPPLGSSKFGSPDGSVSDLDGMGVRSSSTVEENKLDEILLLVGQVCAINLWISQMNNHIPSITNPCVPSRSGSQSLIKTSVRSQLASLHWKHGPGPLPANLVHQQEVGRCSVTMEDPPQLGPTTQLQWTMAEMCEIDPNPNPWSKSPADENSRSAVLLRFPCSESCAGVTAWLTNTINVLEKKKSAKSNARAAASRFVSSMVRKPCAGSLWNSPKQR